MGVRRRVGGGVMGLFGRGKREAVEPAPCRFCGVATREVDRTGKPAHAVCVARVLATVVEEARPSRDSHDVARRLRGGSDEPGGVARRMEAVVYAAVGALVGERRVSR